MKVCITGDSILMTKMPNYDGYKELKDFISQADIKVNNLEMTVTEFDCCASSYCGSPWLTAPDAVFEDITKFGFNCYSFANNHTLDYYERYGADPSLSAHDAIMVRSNGGTRGLETEDKYYRSIMPDSEIKGMPRLADNATAKRLFGELTALSEEYGTKFALNGNEITIDLTK